MQRTTRAVAPILGAVLLALSITGSAFAADKYVALGDSYSAGNGANSTNLNSSCNRNTYAYPYLVSQQRPNTALTFVACSGAVTGDVINGQVNSVTSDTKIVTITIGGNDIGFTSLILACTTLGCQSQINTSNAKIANELPAKLDATYAAIKARAPTAQVVVLGYGRPFANRTCLAATGVSLSEETSLNALVDNMNNTIRARALAYGFSYADVNPYWAGHDICAGNPFTNGLTLLHTADSYHPTRNGYANGDTPAVRAIVG
ncbi:MAG TPA: SGNH/GDSL hydrolase family protein [Baekduia sp.]|uniref:SGNH/GDSL hydrolase family protein n=1 Tax=Baekduia sp. TaxID=2600305 RepID=UPI002BAA79FA|nr:SGNH/GDSL hydrolase family protein [Baekduia sp.]HMJ34944.1 SGNH/GDSL hydrolase family protein [Baekduia sp.]